MIQISGFIPVLPHLILPGGDEVPGSFVRPLTGVVHEDAFAKVVLVHQVRKAWVDFLAEVPGLAGAVVRQ
jgi:hypothetical protein